MIPFAMQILHIYRNKVIKDILAAVLVKEQVKSAFLRLSKLQTPVQRRYYFLNVL